MPCDSHATTYTHYSKFINYLIARRYKKTLNLVLLDQASLKYTNLNSNKYYYILVNNINRIQYIISLDNSKLVIERLS